MARIYLGGVVSGAFATAAVAQRAVYTDARGPLLDFLDVLLSSRADGADWTAVRAALIDEITAGRMSQLDAANLPQLLARLSAARAGYLDNLSAGAVALAAVCTAARLGELDAANLPADIDTLIARLTAARAANLDELAAANIPTDVDTLLTRLSAVRAGYLDELNAPNIPADVDTLIARLTVARAGNLDELAAANVPADVDSLLARLTASRAGYLDRLHELNLYEQFNVLAIDPNKWTTGADGAGSVSIDSSDALDPSKLRLGTGNVLDDDAWAHSAGILGKQFTPSEYGFTTVTTEIRARLGMITNVQSYFGLIDIGGPITVYLEPVDDCAHFFVDTGISNTFRARTWRTAEEETDTGIALDTSWHRFRITWTAAQVLFHIDDVLKATHATRVPDKPLILQFLAHTLGAFSRLLDIDYATVELS